MGFCTQTDVEEFLQIEITGADKIASVNRAITEATSAIKNYTHQEIEETEDEEITLDSAGISRKLFLPELPVTEVSAVVEDDEELTAGSDEDYQLGQWGILHRVGSAWALGIQIITVTYTHGYETLPGDIVSVCTRAASRNYQAGLRSAEVDGVPGVAGESLGDHSVTYGAEGGGGMSEGVMGASAARMLLLSEKDMLDKYRYVMI